MFIEALRLIICVTVLKKTGVAMSPVQTKIASKSPEAKAVQNIISAQLVLFFGTSSP